MSDECETLMKTGENTIAKCIFMLITTKKFIIYGAADTHKNKTKQKKKYTWPGFDCKLP